MNSSELWSITKTEYPQHYPPTWHQGHDHPWDVPRKLSRMNRRQLGFIDSDYTGKISSYYSRNWYKNVEKLWPLYSLFLMMKINFKANDYHAKFSSYTILLIVTVTLLYCYVMHFSFHFRANFYGGNLNISDVLNCQHAEQRFPKQLATSCQIHQSDRNNSYHNYLCNPLCFPHLCPETDWLRFAMVMRMDWGR